MEDKKYTYKGKVVSPEFAELLTSLHSDSTRDIQDILNDKSLEPYIDNILKKFTLTNFKNISTVNRFNKRYDKKQINVGINNDEKTMSTPSGMSLLADFESFIYELKDIIWIKYKTVSYMTGVFVIKFPYDRKTWEKIIHIYLESDDVMYMEYIVNEYGQKEMKFHNPYQ